jgi:magnesium transporter
MLTAFLFDAQQSEQVEDWRAALERLDHGQLLWLAMHEPTEEDVAALQETLGLVDENARRLHEPPRSASVADEGERMHVTLYAASGNGSAPALIPVECVLGPNWIITAPREKIEVLDEFFERAQGGGQIGTLDAPSFVATILDWIVSSYLRALDAVEGELEELDAKVMTNTPKEAADDLTRLVELRRTIGTLRRGLPAPRSGRFSVTPRTRFALERGIRAPFRRARGPCDRGARGRPRGEGVDLRLV